jgi:hypothetical protein
MSVQINVRADVAIGNALSPLGRLPRFRVVHNRPSRMRERLRIDARTAAAFTSGSLQGISGLAFWMGVLQGPDGILTNTHEEINFF